MFGLLQLISFMLPYVRRKVTHGRELTFILTFSCYKKAWKARVSLIGHIKKSFLLL